jgi:hypothetical protein
MGTKLLLVFGGWFWNLANVVFGVGVSALDK